MGSRLGWGAPARVDPQLAKQRPTDDAGHQEYEKGAEQDASCDEFPLGPDWNFAHAVITPSPRASLAPKTVDERLIPTPAHAPGSLSFDRGSGAR